MDIRIRQGENFAWWDSLKYKQTGAPADLTGMTAYSQMRDIPKGKLIADGVCSIDAEQGTIVTTYGSEVTKDIPAGQYGFDVWLDLDGQRVDIDTVEITILGAYTEIEEEA